jgi:hypothetical protein
MSEPDWFEVTSGAELRQGDILPGCPVLSLVGSIPFPLPSDFQPEVDIKTVDLVILTQSCDLDNDKVEEVLLAQVIAWEEAVRAGGAKNPILRSRDFRRALIAGNVPGLSLLHKRQGTPALPWSVVDFHRLFTLSRRFVQVFAASLGNRLRLRSPYREHLAQAFARYFMRVGLPHDAKAFEHEGKADLP